MEKKLKLVIRIDEKTPNGLTSESQVFEAETPEELYKKGYEFLVFETSKITTREEAKMEYEQEKTKCETTLKFLEQIFPEWKEEQRIEYFESMLENPTQSALAPIIFIGQGNGKTTFLLWVQALLDFKFELISINDTVDIEHGWKSEYLVFTGYSEESFKMTILEEPPSIKAIWNSPEHYKKEKAHLKITSTHVSWLDLHNKQFHIVRPERKERLDLSKLDEEIPYFIEFIRDRLLPF